jgi:hypothetical protein
MHTKEQIETSGHARHHELLANSITFPAESKAAFLKSLQDFRAALRPVGFLEERVVETITVADWHRRRSWALGMARVAHAAILQEHSADKFTRELNQQIPAVNTAMAVTNLVDNGRALEYFRRCDAGYSREYRRASQELKELQAERKEKDREDKFSITETPGMPKKSCNQADPKPNELPGATGTPALPDTPGEPPGGSGVSQPQAPTSEQTVVSTPDTPEKLCNQTDPKPDVIHKPVLPDTPGLSQPQVPTADRTVILTPDTPKKFRNQTEPEPPDAPRPEGSTLSTDRGPDKLCG